ncbi:hypothetical protein Esti_005728 [Eimeria stiedai]
MTTRPSAQAMSLASCAVGMCIPLGDPEACRALVMQDLQQLDDSVEFLIVGHRVKEDAAVSVGPPRLHFDWLVALGCLNCGALVELRRDLVAAAEEAIAAATGERGEEVDPSVSDKACLQCRYCGHVIAPLHTSDEYESLVDRMQLKAEAVPRLSSGGIYMYGSRKCYNFGSVGKQAWQQRFLGAEFEEQRLQHHLKIMLAAEGRGDKSTCKETCEKCGHGEAYFSTFQARSADEGMTVMYECTKCHHRRVFNN